MFVLFKSKNFNSLNLITIESSVDNLHHWNGMKIANSYHKVRSITYGLIVMMRKIYMGTI